MLVPLELSIIANKCGYLSPELALGWCIGKYIDEFFNGLDDTRIAAKEEDDASLGLSMMCQKNRFPFPVTIARGCRPWDFLAYHYMTGTVLQFKTVAEYVELPEEIKRLTNWFADSDPVAASRAVNRYHAAMEELIRHILNNPVEKYCRIVELRFRLLGIHTGDFRQELQCRKCGHVFRKNKLLDSDGTICCAECAGFEPSWLTWA
jgi:formylmethanofuran dehydrogenase subunit E